MAPLVQRYSTKKVKTLFLSEDQKVEFVIRLFPITTTISHKNMMNSNLLNLPMPSHVSESSWEVRQKWKQKTAILIFYSFFERKDGSLMLGGTWNLKFPNPFSPLSLESILEREKNGFILNFSVFNSAKNHRATGKWIPARIKGWLFRSHECGNWNHNRHQHHQPPRQSPMVGDSSIEHQ